MKAIKTWLILPLLSYSKLEDGTTEVCIGWLRRVITINLKK